MSICHKLFQHLLLLYPKPFRQEFGNEMLETFQECEHSQNSWSLLLDVLRSVLRQQIRYRSSLASVFFSKRDALQTYRVS